MKGTVSKIIKLSTNIIKKSPTDFKPKAIKILAKIISVFNFQYINYVEEIKNETITYNGFKKNTSTVKGN